MLGEETDLLEAAGIDQFLHPFSRGKFPSRVLLLDSLFASAELNLGAARA
jgi:hypothetical protein